MGTNRTFGKTGRVDVRCIPEERQTLEVIACQERRSLSETLRELIRAEAMRRGLWPMADWEQTRAADGDR